MSERFRIKKISESFRIKKIEATDTTPLSAVDPIEQGGLTVQNREDLVHVVEAPLLEACQRFYDKGIRTVFSSANKKDIDGYAHIALLFDALSPANQQIALSLGKEGMIHGSEMRRGIYLQIPVTARSTVGEIKKSALAMVDKFEAQTL